MNPSPSTDALAQLLARRSSIRAFKPDAVPFEVIRDIASIAQMTPSWCNSQSWSLSIASGGATARIAKALMDAAESGASEGPDIPFPVEYRGVHRSRRKESGLLLYEAVGIQRDDTLGRRTQMLKNFEFFGAPHVAIVHVDRALGAYGAIDCGAYVNSFMLAAESRGVGSVAQAAVAMYPDTLRSQLGLSGDRVIVCGVAFGYADASHPVNSFRTSRASVDEVVAWIDE